MRLPSGRLAVVLVVAHAAALAGGIAAALVLSHDLPAVENLDARRLPQMTMLYDIHGEPLHSFAEQHRTTVPLAKISPIYLRALLATEDPRFYSHLGVDPQAFLRAIWAQVRALQWGVQGGSTITQQLARNQFLHPQKTLTRKAQEMLLALQIEKHYSKEEILTLYCNRIYLGHGMYGVEAASKFYFGKSAAALTLPEAALLAGLTQAPEALTPIRHPEAALRRRNHVLTRMLDEGFIDPRTAAPALKAPLGLRPRKADQDVGTSFVEEARRWLVAQFGEDALNRDGMDVQTTFHPALQKAADRAIRVGLDAYGRRHRQIPPARPLPPGSTVTTYTDAAWADPFQIDDIVPAVVFDVGTRQAQLRVKDQTLPFGVEQTEWTRRMDMRTLFTPATTVPIRVTAVDPAGRIRAAQLAADPSPEAALVALDPATGEILALVGGRDFSKSQFNRATQAKRQAGSAFKPFIVAAALEQGIPPTQLLYDTPTVLIDPGSPEPYQPENYDRDYEGFVTVRHALEHSRNIPTVRLLDAIGYRPAVELAQRLGVSDALQPYPSLALGAFEARLVDMAAAYAAFDNGGVLIQPHFVRSVKDLSGQVLWDQKPATKDVLAPDVAATMVSLMQGVIQRGTAAKAAELGRPLAGKTGTTDDYTDAWFIGFSPDIVAAVWIGHDQRKPLGRGESGALAALPIWIDFMRAALKESSSGSFARPPGLQTATVDRRTGLRCPEGGCNDPFEEVFPAGCELPRLIEKRDLLRASLPYPLQAYPLRHDGALMLSTTEAAELARQSGGRLSVMGGGGGAAMRYAWGEIKGQIALAPPLPGQVDPVFATRVDDETATGRGVDGWPAQRLIVNRTGSVRLVSVPADPQ